MSRPAFTASDGKRFGSLAEAARHEVLLRTPGESLDEILLDALLWCPATERAARSDHSVFDRVEELAAWLVSDPDARISVGEILRVAEEGVPRPDRDPEEQDSTG